MVETANCTTRSARTIDGTSLVVLPTPKRINLNDVEGVRREMGKVYREVREGSVSSTDGSKLVFMLSQIGKMIEIGMLQRRLEQLEKAVGNGS